MEEAPEPEIVFKWTNSCRLCLSVETQVDIFSSNEKSKDVVEMIQNELNAIIYQGDPLPRKLCNTCFQHLEVWTSFRKSCTDTETQLKERLQPYRKIDFVQKYFDVVFSRHNAASLQPNNSKGSAPTAETTPTESTQRKETIETNEAPKEVSSQPVLEPADSTNLFLEKPIKIEQEDTDWEQQEPAPVENEPVDEAVSVEAPLRIKLENVSTNYESSAVNIEDSGYNGSCEIYSAEVLNPEDPSISPEAPAADRLTEVGSKVNQKNGNGMDSPAVSHDDGDSLESAQTPVTQLKMTPWKCPPCDRYFSTREVMISHHRSVKCKGNNVEGFNCMVCYRLFFSEAELLEHQVFHLRIAYQLTIDDLHSCDHCDQLFADPRRLTKHAAVHVQKKIATGSAKHTCATCGQEFLKKLWYDKHVKSHATSSSMVTRSLMPPAPSPPPPPSEFSCSLCPKRFKGEDLLYDHRFGFHGIPDERVSCETCGLKFREASALADHVLTHAAKSGSVARKTTVQTLPQSHSAHKFNRSPENKINRCHRCGRVFKSEEELVRHEAKQHKNRTPYYCRKCSRRFATRTHLLIHQRSHSQSQVVVSDQGSPSVPSPKSPNSPNSSASPPDPQRWCQTCKLQFEDPQDMETHVKSHEMANNPKAKCHFKSKIKDGKLVYRYQCSKCPQLFTCQRSVSRHRQRIHRNGDIQFIRLKRFIVRRRLGKVGLKAFKCIECNHFFKTAELREQHVKDIHDPPVEEQEEEDISMFLEPVEEKKDIFEPVVSLSENYVNCRICDKSFSSNYITKHIKKSHGAEIEPKIPKTPPKPGLKCRFCDKICNNKANLANHESCHDPNRPLRFQCKQCGFRSVNVTMHRIHLQSCAPVKPRAPKRPRPPSPVNVRPPIMVPQPKLRPPTPSSSKPAAVTSALGGFRTCPICLNTYETSNLLELHVMTAHGSEAFERLQNPITLGRLSQSLLPKQRMPELELWREERNKIVRTVNGIHICTLCKVEFASYQAVTWHRSQHPRGNLYIVQIGDSVYQCTVCDRMFSSRTDALEHTRDHSDDFDVKPFMPPQRHFVPSPAFKCPFCSSTFSSEDSIRNHIFYVHPEGTVNST